MRLTRREFSGIGVATAIGSLAGLMSVAGRPLLASDKQGAAAEASPQALFARFEELKWEKMFPDWGDVSPEIVILYVAPKTQATQLMIRNPVALHVPRHWHSANETHTVLRGNMVFECDGKRVELGPGSFNYIPSRMIHQAWLPDNGLVFITVDSAWDINWVEGPPQPPRAR